MSALDDFAKNKAEPWLALHWKTFWGGLVIGLVAGFILTKML